MRFNILDVFKKDENELGRFKSFHLAWKILGAINEAKKGKTPEEARRIAKEQTKIMYENIFKDFGINVNIKFSDNAREDFPEYCEALNNMILDLVTDESKISYFFAGNHTKGSTEAVGAYGIVPNNTRILLKDLLVKLFAGIRALLPIIFYRKNVNKKFTKERNNEIKNTLKSGKRVLIFPDGTRVDGKMLGEFKTSLYEPAFKTITDIENNISKIVTIITTDSSYSMPNSLEKSIFLMGKYRKGNINYIIDFIDASIYENIDDFNSTIHNIIQSNILKNNSNDGIIDKKAYEKRFNEIGRNSMNLEDANMESTQGFGKIDFEKYSSFKKGIVINIDNTISPTNEKIFRFNLEKIKKLKQDGYKVILLSDGTYKHEEIEGIDIFYVNYTDNIDKIFEFCKNKMGLKSSEIINISDNILKSSVGIDDDILYLHTTGVNRNFAVKDENRKDEEYIRNLSSKVLGYK